MVWEKIWFEPNLFQYHFLFLVHSTHIYLPMKIGQSVPKRCHLNSRSRVITQKKAYNTTDVAEAVPYTQLDRILGHNECFTYLLGVE